MSDQRLSDQRLSDQRVSDQRVSDQRVSDDAFLLANTPEPTRPVAASVLRLRASLAAATADLLAIRDAALDSSWAWRDDEADVRYGLYRAIEAIEEATVESARVLRAVDAQRTPAAERIAQATIARWDLHGLLAGLDEAFLDRHPARGEWTAREERGLSSSSRQRTGDVREPQNSSDVDRRHSCDRRRARCGMLRPNLLGERIAGRESIAAGGWHAAPLGRDHRGAGDRAQSQPHIDDCIRIGLSRDIQRPCPAGYRLRPF